MLVKVTKKMLKDGTPCCSRSCPIQLGLTASMPQMKWIVSKEVIRSAFKNIVRYIMVPTWLKNLIDKIDDPFEDHKVKPFYFYILLDDKHIPANIQKNR